MHKGAAKDELPSPLDPLGGLKTSNRRFRGTP